MSWLIVAEEWSVTNRREEFQQNLSESQFEIQRLTDDYTIANEQLAKKEKELSVLKESLNEPSIGYISDDDDFDDEDEGTGAAAGGGAFSDAAAGSAVAATYSERLKTLESEVAGFRKENESAAKQIQEKEEALANAKMIIYSLEKSNKSMLEDLRNRLHDNSAAIVSFLSKNQNLEREMKALRKSKPFERPGWVVLQLYRILCRHRDWVYLVAISSSGDYLASRSLVGQLYAWNVKDGVHVRSFQGKGDIFEVAWNVEETRASRVLLLFQCRGGY